MFYYFRNCSSNAPQVCCEDSPTKNLYNLVQLKIYIICTSPMTLTIIRVHDCVSSLTGFLTLKLHYFILKLHCLILLLVILIVIAKLCNLIH